MLKRQCVPLALSLAVRFISRSSFIALLAHRSSLLLIDLVLGANFVQELVGPVDRGIDLPGFPLSVFQAPAPLVHLLDREAGVVEPPLLGSLMLLFRLVCAFLDVLTQAIKGLLLCDFVGSCRSP